MKMRMRMTFVLADCSSMVTIYESIDTIILLKIVTEPGANKEGDVLNSEAKVSNHGVNARNVPNNSEQLNKRRHIDSRINIYTSSNSYQNDTS
jgi:hypothetical protein